MSQTLGHLIYCKGCRKHWYEHGAGCNCCACICTDDEQDDYENWVTDKDEAERLVYGNEG